jgi:hypothetical protein
VTCGTDVLQYQVVWNTGTLESATQRRLKPGSPRVATEPGTVQTPDPPAAEREPRSGPESGRVQRAVLR